MLITSSNYNKIPTSGVAEVILCKNGLPTAQLNKNGTKRFVHSKYDPVKEARAQTAEFIPIVKDSLTVLVFGLGMAYHLYEILNSLPVGGIVHVFEPCPYVCRLFAENGGHKLLDDTRIRLYTLSETSSFAGDLENVLSVANCDKFSFFAQPIYADMFIAEHNMLVSEINALITGLLTQKKTIRKFGYNWSLNFLANAKYLSESAAVSGLFGLFADKMAIVVSAGPSLSKNVEQLRKAEGKALIICADTAFKELEKHGASPHLLVTASGSPFAHRKLANTGYGNIPLVYKSQSSRITLENHSGMKFYASHINAFLDEDLHAHGITPGILESGGSVSCSCLDLAVKSGATTVVFIGQDFALTGGKAYAENVFGRVSNADLEKYTTETKDIYGNPVKTLINLDMYRRWFEEYIAKHPSIRFIDATEGGAFIAGTEIMTLNEALSLPVESSNIEEMIRIAFAENILSEAGDSVKKKYKAAFWDFLSAKQLLTDAMSAYDDGGLTRGQAENILSKLYRYTAAVRYSILAVIYDIESINFGRNRTAELEALKKASNILDRLTDTFKNASEV